MGFSRALLLFSFAGLVSLSVTAAQPNEKAPKGGTFVRNLVGEPSSLHPIMASDPYALMVQKYIMDSLADIHPVTGEMKPRLAEKWEISKDNKVFTFYLRKGVTFHDGEPVTAEDVKFTFDAIFEKEYDALHWYTFFENLEKVEALDSQTVKFTMKNDYFQNFTMVASFNIAPRHIYSDVEKSKKITRTLVGSGPYKLESFDRGQKIVLKRNEQWFGYKAPEWKGYQNFDSVILLFIKDENAAIDLLKAGELDFHHPMSAQAYEKAVGDPWGKRIFRHRVENRSPKSSSFIAWNLQRPLFQKKNVRRALAHLMNRDEMNSKLRKNFSALATGPFPVFSEYASAGVKPILFDPKKARDLLSKEGWKDTDGDGILDQMIDGQRVKFRFSLLHSSREFEKYLLGFQKDLKKAGIQMDVSYRDWNTFLQVLDSRKFDAVALGWTPSFEWDPRPQWHSSSAVPGGSNFVGFKNEKVDELIDKAVFETDKKRRTRLLRQIYEIIAAEAPHLFVFDDKYVLYATSERIDKSADTFKYDIGHEYWWQKVKKKPKPKPKPKKKSRR